MNHDGGFTRQYRRMWDNPVFRTYQEAAVFSWMKDVAQWRETTIRTKFGPVTLGVGEFLMAEREVADNFGLHRNTLRNLIQRMSDEGMITLFRDRCPHRAGTAVRIVNYAVYQGLEGGSGPNEDRSGTENGAEAGPKQDRSRTKNNEDNEVKEGKESRALPGDALPDLAEQGVISSPANDNPARSAKQTKRGTRVPDGDLPEEWAAAANHTREKHQLPLLTKRVLGLRWANFANYWGGLSGSKALKADWRKTWLNDCIDPRTEKRFPPEPAANANAPPQPAKRQAFSLGDIPLFFDTPTPTNKA